MNDLIGNMILAVHADLCQEFRLRDRLDAALAAYNAELLPDRRVAAVYIKRLALLEGIVKELAEIDSGADWSMECQICGATENDHYADCLVLRAKEAMR